MAVKQLSVYLSNRTGTLVNVTELLASSGINLRSLSLADTENYGILRLITDDTDRAAEILQREGYPAKSREVTAVSVPDEPGALNSVLRYLDDGDVNIEYMYSMINSERDRAYMIIRTDDFRRAEDVLRIHNVKLLNEDEL